MNFQRNPTLMKKSVENLFNETQEVIGISINQAISFTNINVLQTSSNTSNLSLITVNKNSSNSPSNSPNNSPKVTASSENLLNKSSSQSSVCVFDKTDCKIVEDSLKSVDGLSQTSSDLSSNKSGLSDSVDNKQRGTSKLSERAKKKSWYSVLYPSYKSRSEDFKKLFKDVPDSERLVVDYSCALQRDILVHGRLYVSQHYLCFYANIFRWETCLSIKWKEVTAITKEKTARVIPNAICVTTIGEKYFFASFTTRDKAFLMLFRVWQNALMDKPMQPQELWQFVHNSYGDQLGLTTDDEDYIDPSLNTEDSQIKDISSVNKKLLTTDSLSEDQSGNDINLEEISLDSSGDNKILKMSSPIQHQSSLQEKLTKNNSLEEVRQPYEGKRKVTKNNRQRDECLNKNSENLPTDMSNSSDSDDNKNIPFINTAECTSTHEGRQLVHTILPINIDNLFNILFSESKFLIDFHKVRKSTNMVFGKWVTEDGVKTRKVNLTVALAQAVGPKSSNVTETQVMRDCTREGQLYSIDVNSANAGIPYADSFGVKLHYCLVKTVDDHTMLSIHGQIEYKKYIFGVVKGFIERNTWAGLEDFYNALNCALQSECCIPPGTGNKKGAKGRRPRRSGTNATLKTPDEIIPATTTPAEPAMQINVPNPIKILNEPTNQYKWISCFIVFLLFALCIFNVILLIKLNNLEAKENDNGYDSIPDLPENLPYNHKGWIKLLKQQEALHEAEMKKWQIVLQTAIELLRKVSAVCQAITNKEN